MQLVVLNSCFSHEHAKKLAEVVDFVISKSLARILFVELISARTRVDLAPLCAAFAVLLFVIWSAN